MYWACTDLWEAGAVMPTYPDSALVSLLTATVAAQMQAPFGIRPGAGSCARIESAPGLCL